MTPKIPGDIDLTRSAVLLGGSNSVVGHALRGGISKKARLLNLASGASTCMQNLYAIGRHLDDVASADFIITESNVNDSFAAVIGLTTDFIVQNIERYYAALASLKKQVAIIILPINWSPSFKGSIEPKAVVAAVNEAHRMCADRHGFFLLDLASAWKGLDQEILDYLMPDWRHPNIAFMHELGTRLARYFASQPRYAQLPDLRPFQSKYVSLSAKDLQLTVGLRSDSLFSEEVADLGQDPIVMDIPGRYCLLGVSTWSEGFSYLEVQAGSSRLVKPNANIFTFSELSSEFPFEDRLSVRSLMDTDAAPTERTLLCPLRQPPIARVGLAGVLLERQSAELGHSDAVNPKVSLDHLIPDHEPYAASIRFHLKRLGRN